MRAVLVLLMTLPGLAPSAANDWVQLPRAISGQSAGVSHGALIVAGGSSFEKAPWSGGIKQWSRNIYIFTSGRTQPVVSQLDEVLGYGCSVTWGESLIIAGGSQGTANDSRVRRLTWTGSELKQESLPSLPTTLANCAAAVIGNQLYVFGGQEAPDSKIASSRLFVLHLPNGSGGWRELEPLPGQGRILPVLAALNFRLYVFSGAALHPDREYLHDGWIYQPGEGWKQCADTPRAIVAAPSLARDGRLWVFSGDDGKLAPRIAELRDTHPGFSKAVLMFDAASGRWEHRGDLPVGLVTSAACWWQGYALIPGGEDRPGHRSNQILRWQLPR